MKQFNCNSECVEAVATATLDKIKKLVKGKVVYWYNILGDTITFEVYRQGTLMYTQRYTHISDKIYHYENSDTLSADFVRNYKKDVLKHFFK